MKKLRRNVRLVENDFVELNELLSKTWRSHTRHQMINHTRGIHGIEVG